ncbi:MAG: hypothetical protein K0S61_476 [Anaerocolumna sp.]|jgi:hypothetical protein|nr:hypothetical protein [Anaerocolumna sp.]
MYLFLTSFSVAFIVLGLLTDSLSNILIGLGKIIVEPDILITDYIAVGGLGAAFFNAGALMLLSILILYVLKKEIGGISISAIFLMGSFGLFGKNILNVWPLIFGVYLYAKMRREKFSNHIYAAFFSTSIAPIVSEIFFISDLALWIKLPLCILVGSSIGFLVPIVSNHLFHVHEGFSLYNTGFSVGIIGTVYVSFFKTHGYAVESRLIWSTDYQFTLGIFLSIIFSAMIITGFYLNGNSFNLRKITSHSGRLNTDFIALNGFAPVLINMALNGFVSMTYVLLVGGPLNGPTIGGILTIVGFGGFGKHIKNITPIFLGVYLGSLINMWNLDSPSTLLVALFGTSLSPVAGHYGWFFGILASIINSAVVLNLSILHGGMNLYNTGFSSGIVAAFLIPILNHLVKKKAVNL